MTETRAELRAKRRARRAKQQRTDPAIGELRVPLKDLVEAAERRWAAERALSRHLSGPDGGADPGEVRRLEDERDAAALDHELASNTVDRVRLQVRLYRAGGLPD